MYVPLAYSLATHIIVVGTMSVQHAIKLGITNLHIEREEVAVKTECIVLVVIVSFVPVAADAVVSVPVAEVGVVGLVIAAVPVDVAVAVVVVRVV